MTNQTITLILFVNGEDWEVNTVFFETILKSGLEFEFFVYDDSLNNIFKESFSNYANEIITKENIEDKTVALNYFIKQSSGTHFVVITENQLISQNWLTDLLYYYENLEQVGVLSIPTNNNVNQLKHSHALAKNLELCDVLISEKIEPSSVILFSKNVLVQLGAFDENLTLSFAIQQYLFRSKIIGTNNYYIPYISSIQLSTSIAYNESNNLEYINSLKLIQKNNQPFIQLYHLSIKEEMAYIELESVCLKLSTFSEHFFHRYTGEFGILTKSLNTSDITLLLGFTQKFDLEYSIKPFFQSQRNFIITNVLVVFKTI